MPTPTTIAESRALLIARCKRLLGTTSPEIYTEEHPISNTEEHRLPISAATLRRFMFGGPIRVESLEIIERWVEQQEQRMQETAHAHTAHPGT